MSYFYEILEETTLEESLKKDTIREFDKPFFIKKMEYYPQDDVLYITFRNGGKYEYINFMKVNGEEIAKQMFRKNTSPKRVSDIFHERIRFNQDVQYTRIDKSYEEEERNAED